MKQANSVFYPKALFRHLNKLYTPYTVLRQLSKETASDIKYLFVLEIHSFHQPYVHPANH